MTSSVWARVRDRRLWSLGGKVSIRWNTWLEMWVYISRTDNFHFRRAEHVSVSRWHGFWVLRSSQIIRTSREACWAMCQLSRTMENSWHAERKIPWCLTVPWRTNGIYWCTVSQHFRSFLRAVILDCNLRESFRKTWNINLTFYVWYLLLFFDDLF